MTPPGCSGCSTSYSLQADLTRRFSALVGLAAGQILADLRPGAALGACRQRGEDMREADQRPLLDGGHLDLGLVALDRLGNAGGALLRARGSDAARDLGLRVGEHAGVANEAGQDERDPD